MDETIETQSQYLGQGLPGTGGDFIDGADVEGHRLGVVPDGEGDGRTVQIPDVDDVDTEGHLYMGGPSTQGEIAVRVPDGSPHGERYRM